MPQGYYFDEHGQLALRPLEAEEAEAVNQHMYQWAPMPARGLQGGQGVPGIQVMDDGIPWARPIKKAKIPEPIVRDPKKPKIDFKSIPERSTRMPRFKMKYEGVDEMQLRLRHSIVTIRDEPHYVSEVTYVNDEDDELRRGGLGYHVVDHTGVLKAIIHDDHGANLRSPDPGYITVDGKCYHMNRVPARVYKQGLTKENSVFKRASNGQRISMADSLYPILKGLSDRPIIQWTGKIEGGVADLRLSDRVAVVKRGNQYFIHYKNDEIGHLDGMRVKLEAQNYWITRAFNACGVETVL